MSQPAAPPPELVERELIREYLAALTVGEGVHEVIVRKYQTDAEFHALVVLAVRREQQLRQTIADEIEVFADNFDNERGEDEWPIGDGYWSGLRRAATIARGRVSS